MSRLYPAILALVLSPAVSASDHLFDPGFGSGGQRTVPFDLISGGSDRAVRVLRRSNGGYVLVGTASAGSGPRVAIARLTPAGNLDAGFGSGGRIDLDACMSDVVDAALDASDRILVLGNTTACGTAGSLDGRLLRLTAAGAPDPDFAGAGVRNINFTTVTAAEERARALVLRANGEILVGGGFDNDGPGSVFIEQPAVRRLNGSGGDIGTLPGASSSVASFVAAGARLPDGGVVWLVRREGPLSGGSAAFWKMTPALANDTDFGPLGLRFITSAGPEAGCGSSVVHAATAIVPFRGTFKAFGWAVVGPSEVLRSWYASVNDDVGGTGLRIRCLTDALPGDVAVYAAAHQPLAGPSDITLAGICGSPGFDQCALRVRAVNPATPDLLELDPDFNGGLPRVIQYAAAPSNPPAGGGSSVLREANGLTVVAGWRRWNAGGDDDFAVSRLGQTRLLRDGFEGN